MEILRKVLATILVLQAIGMACILLHAVWMGWESIHTKLSISDGIIFAVVGILLAAITPESETPKEDTPKL